MRVLIAEDNEKLSTMLQRALSRAGMIVDRTGVGSDAIWMAGGTPYHAIVLDVMLPGADGFEVARRLRADNVRTPILMLTARTDVRDRIEGLESGADDYMPKPFAMAELVARLRALVRRGPMTTPDVLTVGDLRLDPAKRRVWRGETEIELTAKPFLLLEALMERPAEVLSRSYLLDRCWDRSFDSRSNVVDAQVRHLRDAIDRPFGTESIETVAGAGYRLQAVSSKT
jgi:two-component system OmpR family response regulator